MSLLIPYSSSAYIRHVIDTFLLLPCLTFCFSLVFFYIKMTLLVELISYGLISSSELSYTLSHNTGTYFFFLTLSFVTFCVLVYLLNRM